MCPDCVPAQRLPRQNRFLGRTHGFHGEGNGAPTLKPQTFTDKNKARVDLSLLASAFGVIKVTVNGQLLSEKFVPGEDHSVN